MRHGFGWLSLAVLSGCEAQLCGLLGSFEGGFEGDAEGVLRAVFEEDVGDARQALATFELEGNDMGTFTGSSILSCDGGELTIDLRDEATDELAGSLDGLVDAGSGAGAYGIGDLLGTWSYPLE